MARASGRRALCSAQIGGAPGGFRRTPLQYASKPISRVLYGALREHNARDGHSSATPVAGRLKQPTRTATWTRLGLSPRCRPYSVLLPVGFAVPSALPQTRCALTAPFHPCRGKRNAPRRFASLWHCPWGLIPAGRYPAPFVRGARTFLSRRLSASAWSGRPAD